jgi:hypothetical protein
MAIIPNQPSEPLVALRKLHTQATLVLDFDFEYDEIVRITLLQVFLSRHALLVDPTREDHSELRLGLRAQAALLASLWGSYTAPLFEGYVHTTPESLNLLYGITIDRVAHNAFKDGTFGYRPAHTFRRKLALHLDRLVALLGADSIRLPDVAALNATAADYFAYLAFFHDVLPGNGREPGSAHLSAEEAPELNRSA